MHRGEGNQHHTGGITRGLETEFCPIRVAHKGAGSVGHRAGGVPVTTCGEGPGERTKRLGRELGMNLNSTEGSLDSYLELFSLAEVDKPQNPGAHLPIWQVPARLRSSPCLSTERVDRSA